MNTNHLDAALHYARIGWYVFPVYGIDNGCMCRKECPSPGKHPMTRNGLKDATNNTDTVTNWWTTNPHANIGISTEASGLAVVDIDPDHHGWDSFELLYQNGIIDELPDTLISRTGSGGWHMIFRAPPGGIKNASRSFGLPGIDTRGNGGYIVAPPSLHMSGERYEFPGMPITRVTTGDTLPWPELLTKLMQPIPIVPRPAVRALDDANRHLMRTGAGYGRAALHGEVERVLAAREGERNTTLNRAAFSVLQLVERGDLDQAEAFTALHAAGTAAGLSDVEVRRTIASAWIGARSKPRTGVAA